MLGWLPERRRKRLLEEPFPEAWDGYIVRNVAIAHRLGVAERMKLRELVQVFLAEKHFEGCGGLELTEEMKVTIAAQACLLLLGRDASLYDGVQSILVYPSTVLSPPRKLGVFEQPRVPIADGVALRGEAHMRGPVVLAWDAVVAGGEESAAWLTPCPSPCALCTLWSTYPKLTRHPQTVTAPREAEDTALAYLAITPVL